MARVDRLPETVQALYSELLDQHLIAAAEAAARDLPPRGSFVRKVVKGNRYWYLQRSEGGERTQVYLGPESPALTAWMEEVRDARSELRPDEERRREIVRMLRTAGATVPDAATGRVIQVLGERGLFRSGAVLAGTQAFACHGNVLGVRLAGRAVRTADVDILHDARIALAVDPAAERLELPEALREADPDFLAVPPLDPREPSTSFKVRGRELRVDFVTPAQGGEPGIVRIPRLGIAAQGLPHLGYLMADVAPAVVLYDEGVLVHVPDPARFALHKLWLAQERAPAFHARSRKDRQQASTLIAILAEDRAGDLAAAWDALPGRLRRAVRGELVALGVSDAVPGE